MSHETPLIVYEKLRIKYDAGHQKTQKKIVRVGLLRILVFMAGVLALYISSHYTANIVVAVSFVFVILFISIVVWHANLHKLSDEIARLLLINQNELKANAGDYSGFDDGSEFLEADHPFTADLDIFGKGSVFQYINRTSTTIGKIRLGSWFSAPEKQIDEIKRRQEAITDLKNRVSWRQKFQSIGIWLHDSEEDKLGILEWMKMPAEFSGKINLILLWIIPALSSLVIILLILGNISFQTFTLYLFVPLGIAFSRAKSVMRNHELLSKKAELLEKYGRLIHEIENENFESETLNREKESLTKEHNSGDALKKLSKIIQAFDSRLNIFAWVILNYFMLWDILQARRLESWRSTYKEDVAEWFEIMAYFDAISSLACFGYNHPDFIMPQAIEKQFVLQAEECGHPLLKSKTRVDNPISFDGWKNFIIVTGANMAGKSTYLRTVAVNFILAMTGAPVCAKKFIFSPAEIFTSIRTRDNLLESESYFFAELKRLKLIIDTLDSGKKLFIILDEILKGTNSKDKQEGSKALLKQLIRFDSSGLIATHDLTLGELINEYPENIRNKRFEVEIKNDELDFDYKLKDGISQNLNATFLMKKMGITI